MRTVYPFTLVLFILFIFGNVSVLFAQLEGRYWYFGQKAGIRFDSGGPVKLEDGQMSTHEGCTVASTPEGELLFYSDGISVWNKNHQLMPNGFGLLGHTSSTQSGLIVPKPGAVGRYYIFTVAPDANIPPGLHYSEVDMSLNGGLGDVIAQTKNTILHPGCAEKLTAIAKPNNAGYWVLSHNRLGKEFYTYNVTTNGVETTPIVSAVGESYQTNQTGAWGHPIGCLKFSPNGEWVGAAYAKMGQFELFKFDINAGKVIESVFVGEGYGYGLEFSPNNKLLYIYHATCYQYNLTAGNGAEILNSKIYLGTLLNSYALQLGPDGKIYVVISGANRLGAILNPNELGVGCGFVENAISLGTRFGSLGLPNFPQSLFNQNQDVCENSTLSFFTLFRKSYVCTDCLDGKIAALGIGGVKPYQYSLDNQNYQDSGIFSNLAPGFYIESTELCTNKVNNFVGN